MKWYFAKIILQRYGDSPDDAALDLLIYIFILFHQ